MRKSNLTAPAPPATSLLAGTVPGWDEPRTPASTVLVGVLPGEGIGPEVIDASLVVLKAAVALAGLRLELREGGAIGLAALRESGEVLTPAVERFCREVSREGGALLCGPGGGRFVYDLRARLDLFCKLAPLRPFPALADAGVLRPEAARAADILVVRENLGGLYQGESLLSERDGRITARQNFGYDDSQVTRILRVAVGAATRRRGRLCVVTKPSGVPAISELWHRRATELAAGSGVELRILEIDNACYQLVADARSFDVVAAPNMFGDVLADTAGLLMASRGMTWSGNFAPGGVAVYQTGHGAAHDLAGTGRANPVGQILSVAMMLRESFGLPGLASAITAAIQRTLAQGWRTPDIAAPGSHLVGTRELAGRIAATLEEDWAGEARVRPEPAPVVELRASTGTD